MTVPPSPNAVSAQRTFERSLRTQTKIAIDHGAIGRDNRHEFIVQTTFGLRT
ncbi:hypothetical protein C7S15_8438 [Burkholderia cepacia]|nr:hypothetical protein [Burkholderia cepacia]